MLAATGGPFGSFRIDTGRPHRCQGRGQSGDAGILQGQAQLLGIQLPAAQDHARRAGDGEGGEALLPGAVAEVKIVLGPQLIGGLRRGAAAEDPGRLGAAEPESGLGEAPFPQQGQGPGDGGPQAVDEIGLVQHEDGLQAGLGGQLIQQGQLGRTVAAGGVQDAEPQIIRQLHLLRQNREQRPPPRAGNADGQFLQGSHGDTSF